jgi:hypothetical protein
MSEGREPHHAQEALQIDTPGGLWIIAALDAASPGKSSVRSHSIAELTPVSSIQLRAGSCVLTYVT